MSDVVQLLCSEPQGSVLGPLLFVLYTAELVDIVAEMGINIQHVCGWYSAVHPLQAIRHHRRRRQAGTMERCIAVVDNLMVASRLKMNSDKSEVIWVGSRHTVSTHGCPAIRIGNNTICATNKARLLGVLISTDLTFDQHAGMPYLTI